MVSETKSMPANSIGSNPNLFSLLTELVVTLLDVGYHKATITTLMGDKRKYYYRIVLRGFSDYFVPEKGDGSEDNPYAYKVYEGDSGKISCLAGYPISNDQASILGDGKRGIRVKTPSATGAVHDEAMPLQQVTVANSGTYKCTIVETVDGVQTSVRNVSFHEIEVYPKPKILVPVSGRGDEKSPYVYQVRKDVVGTILFQPQTSPTGRVPDPSTVGPVKWHFTSDEFPSYTPVPWEKIVHERPYISGLTAQDTGMTFRGKSMLFDDLITHHLIQVCETKAECSADPRQSANRIPPVAHPDDSVYTTGVVANPWQFSRRRGESINLACAYRKNRVQGYSVETVRWLRVAGRKEMEFKPDDTHLTMDDNLVVLGIADPDYGVYICERMEDKQGLVRYYHKIVDPDAAPTTTTPFPSWMLKVSDPLTGTGTGMDPWVHAIDENELLYAACNYQNIVEGGRRGQGE